MWNGLIDPKERAKYTTTQAFLLAKMEQKEAFPLMVFGAVWSDREVFKG